MRVSFDLMEWRGRDIRERPLVQRRAQLDAILKRGASCRGRTRRHRRLRPRWTVPRRHRRVASWTLGELFIALMSGGQLVRLDLEISAWGLCSIIEHRAHALVVEWPAALVDVTGYVYGWGRFQKDLGVQGLPITNLASRLTYDGMNTNGGEFFARLDTRQNFMVKGLVGGGIGSNGQMNDEDWLLFGLVVPYSNTVSSVDNRILYGTIDAGYDWLRAPGYKVAPFVGYNILYQNMRAFGCTQIANPFSDCVPPIPTSVLAITEKDTWQSLRLGIAADFFVLPRVRVSADAAYLPYVWFDGTDNHVLRSLVSPELGIGRSPPIAPSFAGHPPRMRAISTQSGEIGI